VSFKSLRNVPPRKKRAGARKLMTLAECWEHFRKEVIPAEVDVVTLQRARMVFYTGAAFYQDQVLAIGEKCETQGLSDDAGAAQLEALACELDEFAGELAVDVAFQMPAGGRTH
jgi:hypothetical protein